MIPNNRSRISLQAGLPRSVIILNCLKISRSSCPAIIRQKLFYHREVVAAAHLEVAAAVVVVAVAAGSLDKLPHHRDISVQTMVWMQPYGLSFLKTGRLLFHLM